MNFGQLIREAWQITWRHPFLWVLGLFAGGTAGTAFGGGGGDAQPAFGGWRGEPRGMEGQIPEHLVPAGERAIAAMARWTAENAGLIVGIVAALLLVGLIVLIVSLIAQGGLTRATADLARGRPSSLRSAWSAGTHLFWRYAGLWLLIGIAVAAIGATVAGFVALVTWLLMTAENQVWVAAPTILVGLLLTVAGIVAGVVASIVVPYAQRAIAVLDIGPLAALREGWRVLRARPGASLLVLLVNIALALGAGLVVTVVMLVLVMALATPMIALWAGLQPSGPTAFYVSVVYAVLAVSAAVGVLLMLVSVMNTFFWSYWTLAYLRLRSEAADGNDG